MKMYGLYVEYLHPFEEYPIDYCLGIFSTKEKSKEVEQKFIKDFISHQYPEYLDNPLIKSSTLTPEDIASRILFFTRQEIELDECRHWDITELFCRVEITKYGLSKTLGGQI